MFQGIILLHCQPCLWEADPTRSQALNGLLAFDVLATVPAKATITSAQLLVYESGKGSGGVLTLETHRVTRAWIEAQVSALKATTTKSWGTVGGRFCRHGAQHCGYLQWRQRLAYLGRHRAGAGVGGWHLARLWSDPDPTRRRICPYTSQIQQPRNFAEWAAAAGHLSVGRKRPLCQGYDSTAMTAHPI